MTDENLIPEPDSIKVNEPKPLEEIAKEAGIPKIEIPGEPQTKPGEPEPNLIIDPSEEPLTPLSVPVNATDSGRITKFEQVYDNDGKITHYIRVHTTKQYFDIDRRTALERVVALIAGMSREFGGADPDRVEYDLWFLHAALRAVIKNGRLNGLRYDSPNIKKLETQIKEVERNWRNYSDRPNNAKRRGVAGFPGLYEK